MKKGFVAFIVKIILILAVAFLAYWGLFYFLWLSPICPNAYDDSYQHALLLQYNALLDEKRDNEVVVFGASYVPFGIDTAVLGELTGKEVQTLGVEADMGTRYLIDVLKKTLKPGDVAVYMLGGSNSYYEDYTVISCALESDKTKLKEYFDARSSVQVYYRDTMIWRKLYSLTVGKPVEFVRTKLSKKEQVYSLDSFDEKGNMTLLREGTLIDVSNYEPEKLDFENVDHTNMDVVNKFSKWCKKNDITFCICYGMLIDELVGSDEKEIEKYHEDVTEYMKAPVLLTPSDSFMDRSFFYNHIYHLNSEGAKEYSRILGEALSDFLDNKD